MNRFATASAVLLASTAIAQAGGLDRTGLPVSPLFEEGNYFELSFGQVMPTVTGEVGPLESGNMANDYLNYSVAVRTDLADGVGFALMYEQAFGADIAYDDITWPIPATITSVFDAQLTGTALTALLSYDIGDNWVVYGGLRYVTMSAEINFSDLGPGLTLTYDPDSDIGHVIGVAYEIPEIALRGSLTYSSETRHNNDISANFDPGNAAIYDPADDETGTYTLPRSILLDFQTGVAEGTLLLASIRWAEWTETVIPTQSALGTIDYDNDVYTYTLGVARRFSDEFAGLVRLSYEQANGGEASNLAPTDGLFGVSLAGIYTIDNIDITAGVNFTHVGDATTETITADFSDNYVVGAGLRVGVSF